MGLAAIYPAMIAAVVCGPAAPICFIIFAAVLGYAGTAVAEAAVAGVYDFLFGTQNPAEGNNQTAR